ncbi:MAG: SPFH domain-containing protein [Promethearchaeota archaeon]
MMEKSNPTGNTGKPKSSTASWERDITQGMETSLIKRFPNSVETLSNTKAFCVKEHERAILLRLGEFVSEMESGTYELDKQARKPGTEVIWIDTTIHQMPWGLPQTNGLQTKDGFVIGLYGDLKISIAKPVSFYKNVVGGAPKWQVMDLKQWIKGILHTSLRDIYGGYNLLEIFKEEREAIKNRVSSKLVEEFYNYGLVLETFNVLGYKSPPSAQQYIESTQTTTMLQNEMQQKNQIRNVADREQLADRITSLKSQLRELQDKLINNQITKEEFKEKRNLLTLFLDETKVELHQISQSRASIPGKEGES